MPDPNSRIGAALEGRYRIERKLGEGGMATVYLAEDLRHERKVALKVLKAEVAAAVGAERFLVEIKTTANLLHPHILPLFDSGEADGFLFYVMPYVEGESLEKRLEREHQLPVNDAVRIATNVAQALDYAHRKGIVHRDVKPANILLRDGDALVADFGIALAIDTGARRLTETGFSLGTPEYMSPEQATADSSVGAATDVWALGCVLYEMLVGEPPYGGTTPQAILGKIITGSPDPVNTRRRTAPANVAAAVAKAMEKVPADRFTTAQEFVQALANPGFRHGETDRGRRLVRLALIAIVFYGLGVLTWSAVRGGAPESQGGPPVSFVIPGGSSSPLGRTIAISRDGSLIAVAKAGVPLSVRRVTDFGSSTDLGQEEGLQPFFSPDGHSIGYFDGIEQSLMRIPTARGIPTLVARGTGARALGGSWGDDGTIVFATTSGLYRVSADGGEAKLLKAPDRKRGELYYSWPVLAPGNNAVLFTIVPEAAKSDGDGSIASLDLETGELTVILTGGSGPRYASTGHLLYTAKGGTLHAVAFNPASKAITGERVELPITGLAIATDRAWGADFDIALNGTLVFVLADQQPNALVWIDRAGREEFLSAPPRHYGYLRISPDGKKIATDVRSPGRDVYIWDIARETALRLTTDPGEEFFAEWSLGGDSLYYSSNQSGGSFNVYRRAADGTGLAQLVNASTSPQMVQDLTPDGRQILVAEGRKGSDAFDLMTLLLQQPVRLDTLLSTPSAELNPSVSPDGRFVAYQSDVTGQYEVYVSPFTGSSQARWKVSTDGGEHPLWSRTGDTIFFRSRSDSMMAAAVRRTPTFAVRAVAALFSLDSYTRFGMTTGRSWDLSPIDGRFLRAKNPPAAQSGIRVVLNWQQELRRLMEH
jgi:hypothetical protein